MQINSDNSKVNVNMLERIAELEDALREIKNRCAPELDAGWQIEMIERIALKALGETK